MQCLSAPNGDPAAAHPETTDPSCHECLCTEHARTFIEFVRATGDEMGSWFTTSDRMCRTRVVVLCISLWLLLPQMIHAQAQDRCEEAIAAAETQYVEGRFSEVLTTLAPCMNRDDILIEDAVAAYRLRALAFIRRGDVEEARLAIIELLSRDPEYLPDPIQDIPSYVALVDLVRRELQLDEPPTPVAGEPAVDDLPQDQRRSWFRSNRGWLIAGGSAALVGIITAVAASGGGGGSDGTLPGPPVMPD